MLPKFSISTEASLGETLQEMGVTNAFSDAADLSGISQDQKLKVSKVGPQLWCTSRPRARVRV